MQPVPATSAQLNIPPTETHIGVLVQDAPMSGPLEDALIRAMHETSFITQVKRGADQLQAQYRENDAPYRAVLDTSHKSTPIDERVKHIDNQQAALRVRADDLADLEVPEGAVYMRAWTDHGRPVMKYFLLEPQQDHLDSSEHLYVPPVDERTPRSELRLEVTTQGVPRVEYRGLSYNNDNQEHLDLVLQQHASKNKEERIYSLVEDLGNMLSNQFPALDDLEDSSLEAYANAVKDYVVERNNKLGSFSIS